MSASFTDYERLKREAKKSVELGHVQIRRWWSEKYKQPANDPRFEERSLAEWAREMWEDCYERKGNLETRLEEATGHERQDILEQLERLAKALDEDFSQDPLADKWERELMEGKIPDLDEQV